LKRLLLFCAPLVFIALLSDLGFAQSSITRATLLCGGGTAGAGTVSLRAGFGETFVTTPAAGASSTIRAGIWLPVDPAPTGVDDTPPTKPVPTALGRNFPNPFNPRTVIPFSIATSGHHVQLTIYDLAGRRICDLVDDTMPAGTHAVTWNGTDANQRTVAAGVYFYVLETPGFRSQRKFVLVR